jgi:GAF domain-containing protein/HAMP domain-containing protein
MGSFSPSDTLQLITWFLLVAEFILALYILLLNPRHSANRHVSALLFLFAMNTLSTGLLLSAREVSEVGMALSAATTPALQPGLFLVSVVLLKPIWMERRWRPLWWLVYGLSLLPIILTLVDLGLGTRLWYTGVGPEAYAGGFASLSDMANGLLAPLVRILNIYLMGLVPIVFLLYFALVDKEATRMNRRLAWLLLGTQIATVALQFVGRDLVGAEVAAIASGGIFVLAYAYAGFQQMVSQRRGQWGRLQPRLTAVSLAITVPLLITVLVIVSTEIQATIEENSEKQLEIANRALAGNVEVWLDLNLRSLQQLVSLPDIISMEAEKQKPILEAMATAFPHMYLVSTTDLDGINVARNDDVAPKDYSDRPWFRGARAGAPLTFQSLIGRTSGEPALVASMPIRDQSGQIVGVGMFASDLTDIAEEVLVSKVGETGFAYVVDAKNEVLAHPDPVYSAELRDLTSSPPVVALRYGNRGLIQFDDEGQRWRAYVDELDHGWGVVVQQPEAELLADLPVLWLTSGVVAAGGIVLLVALSWLTIRQMLLPIGTLTETATSIAAGDLTRVAPVESEDEIGLLAGAFNRMTVQLRDLIGGLEQQVADRTRDLEHRSAYLEATAEVGRAAASILDPDALIQEVVELIRERFGLYYVGLFLVDEASEWAVLQAGTGEAGRTMLARGHRIRVGEGMIGWSVARGQPRVALEAGEDAVRLATAELPGTRSEAALPLQSRGRVLGALTVQHTGAGAFDPETMAVLQTMADQVAVALDNAHLFAESQEALETSRRAYGEMSHSAWTDLLRARPDWGYRYAHQTVARAEGDWQPEMLHAEQSGQIVQGDGDKRSTLAIPLKVRDEVVGVLSFRKDAPRGTQAAPAEWTSEETAVLEAFAAQLEQALESAQLFQATQRRAARDRLLGEIATRMRETLDIETVLRTTVHQVRQALDLPEVVIRLMAPPADPSREPNNGG